MHKIVYSVFKTIFLSMMLIFVFDLGFYMYRALSINGRMESLMTSMQKIVIENNYLPEQDYIMYKSIFQQLADDMNQGDVFIAGIGLNYDNELHNQFGDLVQKITTWLTILLLIIKDKIRLIGIE